MTRLPTLAATGREEMPIKAGASMRQLFALNVRRGQTVHTEIVHAVNAEAFSRPVQLARVAATP